MLVVDGEFVARRAVGDPFLIGLDLDQGHHRAAAGRVDPQPGMFVGDRRALNRFPRT